VTDINEIEKYVRFYLVPDLPMVDGSYRVTLQLTDGAGNQYSQQFYIIMGSPQFVGGLNFISQNLQTEVTEVVPTPAETEEEQQQLEEEGAVVTVSVIDQDGNQLGGVGVSILETQQSGVSDDQGQIAFTGVVAGAYTVEVATDNQTSQQNFTVEPGNKEVAVTIQVTFVKQFYWQGVLTGAAIVFLAGWLLYWFFIRDRE
jgi:hypothetical protein